ncbi:uncharacterized protein LOC131301454 isoform X2 [Rhododendron vialii]|uniref:uncharacterized protein LOC131301454 isoform X2 n=1 Tax=Rhododendron vialii TaxID=182163 RepID=UPI00265E140A|nr:uncharacterized protein LOC131301454 isoform X2 [Rhododendron vialii]
MKKTRHSPFPSLLTVSCTCWEKMARCLTNASLCWTALQEANLFPIESFFPIVTGGHAVLDKSNGMENNKILFHCKIFPDLYYYNIELDSWGTFSKSNLGIGKKTSALVDGILYCLDYWKAGFMFGLDISNPKNELQIVLGFENKSIKEKKPLPQPGPESSPGPRGFLVSMGNSKLARIWAGVIPVLPGEPRSTDKEPKLLVSCAILNMSKQPNPTIGGVDFVAETLSVSYYNVLGSRLINCLPVLQKEEAKIAAWENLQKTKAEAAVRKLEVQLITDVRKSDG